MPLLKGKKNIGKNIETEESHGKPHEQAVAIALRTAGVPPKKAKDAGMCLQCGVKPAQPGEHFCCPACETAWMEEHYPEDMARIKQTGGKLKDGFAPSSRLRSLYNELSGVQEDLDDALANGDEDSAEHFERQASRLSREIEMLENKEMSGQSKDAAVVQRVPTAARVLPVHPVPMPSGEHNEPSLAPVPVEDVEGYTDSNGTFHPISGTKGYRPSKAGGVGHGPRRKKNKRRRAKDDVFPVENGEGWVEEPPSKFTLSKNGPQGLVVGRIDRTGVNRWAWAVSVDGTRVAQGSGKKASEAKEYVERVFEDEQMANDGISVEANDVAVEWKRAEPPIKARPLTSVSAPTQADVERIFGKKPTPEDFKKTFGKDAGNVRIVYNKLLGGWYIVRGPHQTPLSGRFNSKEEAQTALNSNRTGDTEGSIISGAMQQDRRDAKIIKEEAAGGQLTAEDIARKHGFPVQFVKDVLAGKPLPTREQYKDRSVARDASDSLLDRAFRLEIAGDRRGALDLYKRAEQGFRRAGDTRMSQQARDGADDCRRSLTGLADLAYDHPQCGRSKAYDIAGLALRAALERARAGERVDVVGNRVMPRAKVNDASPAGVNVPRHLASKEAQFEPGVRVYNVTGEIGTVTVSPQNGRLRVSVDGGGLETWDVNRTFRYHDPILARDAESQYADEYIDSGYTPGSFLHSRLRGVAKSYAGKYEKALINAMQRRERAGTAFQGKSHNGYGKAWYSKPQDNVEPVPISDGHPVNVPPATASQERTELRRAPGNTEAKHEQRRAKDEHLGWKKLVSKLRHEGKSKAYAEKIAGKINAEKYGHAKDAAGKPTWQPDSPNQAALEGLHRELSGAGYKYDYSAGTGKKGELVHVYRAPLGALVGALIYERKNGNHGKGRAADVLPVAAD